MAHQRKFTLKQSVVIGLMLSLSHAVLVDAAGLGTMRVLSQMGQPFLAEIDLVNVTREELATLNATLAPPAAYEAANMRFDPTLNTLRLSVERRPNGTPYIRATTARAVNEPYLNVMVDLTWQGGKFRREYGALLDPPGLRDPVPAAPAAASPPATTTETAPTAAKSAPRPAARATPAPKPDVAVDAPAKPPATSAPAVAAAPATPTSKVAATPPETKPAEAIKPEPSKTAPPATVAEASKPEAPKSEAPAADPTKPEGKEADAAPPSPASDRPEKVAPPPTPAAQGGMLAMIMDNLLPIGAGLLALLAGLGALWGWGRRKPTANHSPAPIAPVSRREPGSAAAAANTAGATATAAAAATIAATVSPSPPPELTVANVTDMVDPIEEAQVYLDHGRDEQAEEILREALAKQPAREDVHAKLLELLATRGDKDGFNRIAANLHKLSGGVGERWQRATVLGYALDPTNPLYPATGKVAELAVPAEAVSVDLDLSSPAPAREAMSNTTDILIGQDSGGADMAKTMVLTRDAVRSAQPAAPPPDLDFELPAASSPAAPPAAKDDNSIDFKIDFPAINLSLDDKPALHPATTLDANDAHWQEVQQKFDLARAYQEMGDKEGALEALQEVMQEGDETQKALAQKMIEALK